MVGEENDGKADALDTDDDSLTMCDINDAARWYLDSLERLLPHGDAGSSASHPKISATVQRVTNIWKSGEKILVFCHYIATGRILRLRIGEAIDNEIQRLGAKKLGCPLEDVPGELARLGDRFFDTDSPVRRACDRETRKILEDFPALGPHESNLLEIVRRNVRTPSFLVRFFALDRSDSLDDALVEANAYLLDAPADLSQAEKAIEGFNVEVPKLCDIFQELLQVEREFDGVKYSTEDEALSIVTEPIELEGIFLGDFQIRLNLKELVEMRRNSVFSIVALDPHPAGCNESVTHPHVRDEGGRKRLPTSLLPPAERNGIYRCSQHEPRGFGGRERRHSPKPERQTGRISTEAGKHHTV